jgi:hypothetical protein
MTTDDKISALDRDALERALVLAQRESQGRREQIERMLSEDGWFKAAHFAAYSRQIDALKLKPWQSSPLYGHLGDDAAAAALLQRLLDADLSRFEPDPIGALAALEARLPPA